MPNPARTPSARPRELWLTPLPHPSWSGETAPALARPIAAAEFWRRLGL